MSHPAPDATRADAATSLLAWARTRGAQVAWGGVEALAAAGQELHRRREAREIDPEVDATHLGDVSDGDPPSWATRIVVVALPRPAHRVRVHAPGGPRWVLLPPTYLRYRSTFEDVRRELVPILGSRTETSTGPLKATAARLGLVEYGRNNLTYAKGAGSYIQLLGYLTAADLPLAAGWAPRTPRLMSECEGCTACLTACPTGAIGADRVLLHTERCLTCVNELAGDWPAWMPRLAHHTLVGCLRCQVRCPRNPRLPVEDAGIALTAEETTAVLAGQVPPRVHGELARIDQAQMVPSLPRNLAAALRVR